MDVMENARLFAASPAARSTTSASASETASTNGAKWPLDKNVSREVTISSESPSCPMPLPAARVT